ncbi:MAG: prephenate dehydratase [Ruminococcaceae bacterium]|nr:prephenate dehydratase [Oscillospiraceae bacterium]
MLNELRKQIDSIDSQMLALFEARMDVAKQVGAYKKERNLPIFVPEREQAVIESRVSALKNPEYAELTADFFNHVMQLSRRLQASDGPAPIVELAQEEPRVAYLGRPGSFSEEALFKFFPKARQAVAAETFAGIFKHLKDDRVDYGVLPIENTSTGTITEVLDLLCAHDFYIIGEAVLKVNQNLAALPGTRLSDVRRVYSHPQALAQCADFLNTLPDVQKIPLESTADSAHFVAAQTDGQSAAVVSKRAADLYGLAILKEAIQGNDLNTTRFVVIAKERKTNPKSNKISLVFTLPHESGSLHNVLSCFARHGLNLLYIESRPLPGRNFEYSFYTDFTGTPGGIEEQTAIDEIRGLASSLRILGCYPAAEDSLS